MFIFAISLLNLAMNALSASITSGDDWIYDLQMILIPLLLAYLLFKTACKDRLRGLLAAVSPIVIFWGYFKEFVPAVPLALAWSWMFILAFSVTVSVLRTKWFTSALGLIMVVPIRGGFPFT
jgi:hypothetical protein